MKLMADRSTVPSRGGTRYLSIDFDAPREMSPFDVVFVMECSPAMEGLRDLMEALRVRLRSQSPQARWVFFDRHVRLEGEVPQSLAFADGCALREAWLRACHSIAADIPGGRPGHCILITQGKPEDAAAETLPPLAGQIWEHTGIATSVLAVGQPSRPMLRALAWQGGGHYCRVREAGEASVLVPVPRILLELSPATARILTPVRHMAALDGALSVVVSGLRHLVAEVAFGPGGEARAAVRLAGEEVGLVFERGRGGRRNPRVMRRVAAALAQRIPAPEPAAPVSTVRTVEGGAGLVGRFVPARVAWPDRLSGPWDPAAWRDSIRGAILWGAAGSALGRGLSGLDPATIRARYGAAGVKDYQAFVPGLPDSAGMVSGDVHMLRELALSMQGAEGYVDPEEFGRRLVQLLPHNRGMGAAADRAAHALMDGVPWYQAGVESNSGGNGAALRVAPVGLVWAVHANLGLLYRNAVVSAVVTHTHPIGVSGAVVMALAVAWCSRRRLSGRSLAADALLEFLASQVADIEQEATSERRQGLRVRMSDRLREVGTLLEADPDEALSVTWNGAFALESVPAALYCFLRHSDDPRRAVEVAVNAGFDADSVGSMTGHLAGAWCGAERLRRDAPTWWAGLEGRDGLIKLADQLYDLAVKRG
ncbi:MAG TPA: ADP-ribosylglycohydrolase family protein [Candidatus Xenobia bacterium]|jgi:ADP-ribosylglycohydrolase